MAATHGRHGMQHQKHGIQSPKQQIAHPAKHPFFWSGSVIVLTFEWQFWQFTSTDSGPNLETEFSS